MRIATNQEGTAVREALEGVLNEPITEEEKTLHKILTEEADPKLTVVERTQQYNLLQTVIKARKEKSNNPQRLIQLKKSFVTDLYSKLSGCSF